MHLVRSLKLAGWQLPLRLTLRLKLSYLFFFFFFHIAFTILVTGILRWKLYHEFKLWDSFCRLCWKCRICMLTGLPFFFFLREKQKKQEQNWKNKKGGGGGALFCWSKKYMGYLPKHLTKLDKTATTTNVWSMRSTTTTQMFEILIGEYSLSDVSVSKCGFGQFLPQPPTPQPHLLF